MQAELDQLFDHALNEGVRMMGERYGLEAADGAITRPTLEAALEVLPPPHRRFVQEHLDYYRRRFAVMEKEGAEAVLAVWSLAEPLVRMVALNQVPDLKMLPWARKKPLRKDFRDAPLLTRQEVLRQVAHVLKVEGFAPREGPVLLPPESGQLVAEVAARLRMVAEGRSLEDTARLLVERNRARWEQEGEAPQAVVVADVGGPIPVMLAFDDPRPILWENVAA